ncbi:hypothetical protein [Streptomyces sp. NPDC058401]|uniref:hypothetical protein n=1 Tax=Streptomyces sp. NPDC058401 TaxID=3346480 RepID=UPI00364777D9
MTNQIPRYGEQVMKADVIFSEEWPEYAEVHGTPVWGNATRYNHIQGLVTAQGVETDSALLAILAEVAPALLKPIMTSGALHKAAVQALDPVEGTATSVRLERIDKAVKRRNRVVHDKLNVVVMVEMDPRSGPDKRYPSLGRSEHAYLGGEPVTEESLLSDLAVQQDGTRAAVQILVDLHC